jgi:hexosaminidase
MIPSFRLAVVAAAFSLLFPLTSVHAEPEAPAIVPRPAKMEVTTGSFTLTPQTAIIADQPSMGTAHQLVDALTPATGFALKISAQTGDAKTSITLTEDATLSRLGKEGYQLTVTPQAIHISAATQAGLFYGIQTLRQLLPPQIFSATAVKDIAWTAPDVTIEDTPRFPWRGLMLDSGHDFQNKAFVLRFIDLMAIHKFNVFHWHLTDLGDWSIEIKSYPKLQDANTRGPGVKPGFYTQDEIREVIAYAAARHINIMPEVDMPGHSPPALLAYPELDCQTPEVDKNGHKTRPWQYCVGNEQTYKFLEAVLTQIADLFPSQYIHIGGDECPKTRWLACPLCAAKMQAEHLKTGDELQSYFIQRIEKFLQTKNRRLVGWDEILEGGLAPNATVMSWRGMRGGIAAAKAGHDVVMAPTEWTYFDYPKTTLEKVYSFEPIPKELTPAEATHILGAQAQMWTDYHPSEQQIEGLVYPRAAALSEVVWSPAASRNYEAFVTRIRTHLQRLKELNVHYTPIPAPSTPVGRWTSDQTSATPKTFEWPLTEGIKGPGQYEITFQYEHGASRLQIHSVEIVQNDKVLASDKHFGWTGGSNKDNVYRMDLPVLTDAPLLLRASISTDFGPESYGRISVAKVK